MSLGASLGALACGDPLVGWRLDAEQARPEVVWTFPADEARGVALHPSILGTFSEPMDVRTLTSETLVVSMGSVSVRGVVIPVGVDSVMFWPELAFEAGARLTAVIGAEARDRSGTSLGRDHVWSFTTEAHSAPVDTGGFGTPTDAEVGLGLAELFVALAGAGLQSSNREGLASLSGDVGLSPSPSCTSDDAPCSAGNPVINGRLFADDRGGVAARAKQHARDAFDEAMARPAGTLVGDLSALTLAPGVYTSASEVTISAGAITILDGGGEPGAVWIFQVGTSLRVEDGAIVLLVNGARPDRVYWAIEESATFGSNVFFQGTALCDSSSVGSGSVVVGRLLCRNGSISLLSSAVALPGI